MKREYYPAADANDPHITRLSVELRFLRICRGHLLGPGDVMVSVAALRELRRAARWCGQRSLYVAIERGWLPDLQSVAIAAIEGPS